jgi:NAD(P)-dependent dehydrogenase (short-subunit alcohol dehydrogenase family)
MKPLEGKVALVAGATRGAGRGIACMLGEAGATVYCSGRSARGRPNPTGYFAGRPETIDETAEMVSAKGGVGLAVRTDHLVEEQVEALAGRIRREQGRLDVLVNDISEGEEHEWLPFWKLSLDKGFRALRQGVHSHIITSRHAVPLLIERRRSSPGLIVEVGDGDTLAYRQNLFYDLVKVTVSRLAYAMAEELYRHRVAAVALTPGYMRTEAILDHFGVTEANWRQAGKKDPHFLASETPCFVGRAVAALAADPRVLDRSGGLYSSWGLAREYGFTDVDGSRPDLGERLSEFPFGPPRTGIRWTLARLPDAEQGGGTAEGPRKRGRARRTGGRGTATRG